MKKLVFAVGGLLLLTACSTKVELRSYSNEVTKDVFSEKFNNVFMDDFTKFLENLNKSDYVGEVNVKTNLETNEKTEVEDTMFDFEVDFDNGVSKIKGNEYTKETKQGYEYVVEGKINETEVLFQNGLIVYDHISKTKSSYQTIDIIDSISSMMPSNTLQDTATYYFDEGDLKVLTIIYKNSDYGSDYEQITQISYSEKELYMYVSEKGTLYNDETKETYQKCDSLTTLSVELKNVKLSRKTYDSYKG